MNVRLRMVLWLLFNTTFIRTPRAISLALLFSIRESKGWVINFLRVSLMKGVCYHQIICIWIMFGLHSPNFCRIILKQWNSHHIRRSQNHTISEVPDEMYYLPENFRYEPRRLVLNDKHVNNIFQQKNIYEEANNVTEPHGDLQDYFWHVVNCEKPPFPSTTCKEASMIFKVIIEKTSI